MTCRILLRAIVVGAAALAGACIYPPASLDNLTCDAEHACIADYTCVGGLCIADGAVPAPVALEGSVEKGPYIEGTTIEIVALGDDGVATGQVFPTSTGSDLGEFQLPLQHRGLVLLRGNGYYYNEVLGRLSTSQLELASLYQIDDDQTQTARLNIITHLAHKRALRLMSEGSDYLSAVRDAETELIGALAIGAAGATLDGVLASQLSVVGSSSHDAYLFLVSVVLTEAAVLRAAGELDVDANLQELVNQIAADLEDDGVLDAGIAPELDDAEMAVDVDAVRASFEQRLDDVGSTASAPDVSGVIDRDQDGQADGDDLCPREDIDPGGDSDGDGVGDACECGNGIENVGEECDDGNTAGGDGCDSDCRIDTSLECVAGATCTTEDGLIGVCRDDGMCVVEGGCEGRLEGDGCEPSAGVPGTCVDDGGGMVCLPRDCAGSPAGAACVTPTMEIGSCDADQCVGGDLPPCADGEPCVVDGINGFCDAAGICRVGCPLNQQCVVDGVSGMCGPSGTCHPPDPAACLPDQPCVVDGADGVCDDASNCVATAAACPLHNQCGPNRFCDFQGSCMCFMPGCAPMACETDAHCLAGWGCDVAPGQCVPVGEPCAGSADCPAGDPSCVYGVCQPPECSTFGASCMRVDGSTGTCQEPGMCVLGGGTACQPSTPCTVGSQTGVCSADGSQCVIGCADDTECQSGMRCVDGQCTSCGNGVGDGPGETCDDGNNVPGDGCDSDCVVEAGWTCPATGGTCTPGGAGQCGNSLLDGAETCDDGNTVGLDGCSPGCVVEPGWTCPTPGMPCTQGGGTDGDGDGVPDADDNCPGVPNPKNAVGVQEDFDWDGKGNACDCGDGWLYPGAGFEDCDDGNTAPGDGCGATCFIEPDFDCVGAPSFCTLIDIDQDGLPDATEDRNRNGNLDPGETDPTRPDTDGDGFSDGEEDKNKNGLVDPGESNPLTADADVDGDRVPDSVDNCPNLPNPLQSDVDGDGLGAECDGDDDNDGLLDQDDGDDDGDGVGDALDVCPTLSGPVQNDYDGDGLGDACDDDDDEDGFLDGSDNCPLAANAAQQDTDQDGLGDACDDDADGDTLSAPQENAKNTSPTSRDTDNDGVGDAWDNCPTTPNPDQANSDGDSWGDACDP